MSKPEVQTKLKQSAYSSVRKVKSGGSYCGAARLEGGGGPNFAGFVRLSGDSFVDVSIINLADSSELWA
jgi:hypothetical protein